MAATNQNGLATPPTTPPALDKAQILTNVLSLASQFSTCVEAFNLIHPTKEYDTEQKIVLAKLGLQQGRLLIFGDVVGISSPPPTIARHMVPSHPGVTNPDPHLPVNFGIRDPRLDEPGINQQVRAALDHISGRPVYLSREQLMEKFGLKVPKRMSPLHYPALDTNRLEAFREKYTLLQDLAREMGVTAATRRGMSMAVQHWNVVNVSRFEDFVKTVRIEVDGLIALLGVKEQVDRGMRTDIRAMGWHPDLSSHLVRQDWEKLRLIEAACLDDYPEYVEVTRTALNYIGEEFNGTNLPGLMKGIYQPIRRKSQQEKEENNYQHNYHQPDQGHSNLDDSEKRPSFLSHFKFKSWGKTKGDRPSKSFAQSSENQDPPRSKSEVVQTSNDRTLEPVRSKSLSHVPDDPVPLNLDMQLGTDSLDDVSTIDKKAENLDITELERADTANSLIERHDMFKGPGRVETKDIRAKAHDWAT